MLPVNMPLVFVLYYTVVMLVCVRTKIWAVHLNSEDLEYIFSIFEENKVLIFQGILKTESRNP